MSAILDLIYVVVKGLWKFSRFAVILIVAFCIEIALLMQWKEKEIRQYFYTSDLSILNVETIKDEDQLSFLITIRNDGSLECSHLPSIRIYCDEESDYLEAEDIYSGTVEKDEYTSLHSIIPGKTNVTVKYQVSDYFYIEEYEDAKNISLQIEEYDTMNVEPYQLSKQ